MKTRLDVILETVTAILEGGDRPSQDKDKPEHRYGSLRGLEGMIRDHMKDNPGMSRKKARTEVVAHITGFPSIRKKKK